MLAEKLIRADITVMVLKMKKLVCHASMKSVLLKTQNLTELMPINIVQFVIVKPSQPLLVLEVVVVIFFM